MPQGQQNEEHSAHHTRGMNGTAIYRRRTVRLLVAHDRLSDVDLWLQELKRVQFAVSAEVVQTPQEFAVRLGTQRYDVVLATGEIPNWTGAQILELLKLQDTDIPFIYLGTENEKDVIEECIAQGASDCVYRNRLARLPVAVAIAVEQKSLREERNRAEAELRRSEAHYHALRENPHYGIFQFDPNGQFLAANAALAAMLGYESTSELVAMNLAEDIIRDPAERTQLLEAYRQKGHIDPIEMEWKRKDGTPMRVRLSGRRVDTEQGAARGELRDYRRGRHSATRLGGQSPALGGHGRTHGLGQLPQTSRNSRIGDEAFGSHRAGVCRARV